MKKSTKILSAICLLTWSIDTIQHIGHMAGWSGAFFETGLSDVTILCSLIICVLTFLHDLLI